MKTKNPLKKGDTFGHWTVISDVFDMNRHKYVQCKCDCGEIKNVRCSCLLDGTSTSCGCLRRLNISECINKKFNKLTILEDRGIRNKSHYVLCRCDCGKLVEKEFRKVVIGESKSCNRCNYYQINIGDKFGRWTVIGNYRMSPHENDFHREWLCQCSCDKKTITYVNEANLKRGKSKSCGCITYEHISSSNKKHGDVKTRLYRIWCGMRERCNSPICEKYHNYGGRGITVCEEWDKDFVNFKKWALDNGYKDNLTIDRIDVNGNYEPSNCRWVTIKEQVNNKRNNVRIVCNGESHTIAEWSAITNLKYYTISYFYHKGINMEDFLKNHTKGE